MEKISNVLKLSTYINRQKKMFLGIIIFSLMVSFFNLIPIQILGTAVDIVGGAKIDSHKLIYVKLFGNSVINLIIIFGVMTLLEGLLSQIYGYLVVLFNNRIISELRKDTFIWILNGDKYSSDKVRVGDAISRITGDVESVNRAIAGPLNGLLTNILTLLFSVIVFLIWNVKLAITALLLTPILYFLSKWVTRKSQELAKIERKEFGSISEFLSDVLSNINLIKSYHTEKNEEINFDKHNEKINECRKSTMKVFNLYWPAVKLIQALGYIITILITYYGILQGEFSVGDIFVVFTYVTKIYNPIILISRFGNEIYQADAALGRVFALENILMEENNPYKFDVKNKGIDVELKNISISNDSKEILRDISFHVKKGQLITITGESGSGKSTLISIFAGLSEIKNGKLLFDKVEMNGAVSTIRKNSRVCFQNPFILKRSIKANLFYGSDVNENRINELCEKLGIDKIIDNRGYDYEINSLNKNLSGGEQKRFAIIRTINKYSPIYVFDEPTAELDYENREKVISILKELKGLSTILIATHDEELLKIADKTFHIENGRLSEGGN